MRVWRGWSVRTLEVRRGLAGEGLALGFVGRVLAGGGMKFPRGGMGF